MIKDNPVSKRIGHLQSQSCWARAYVTECRTPRGLLSSPPKQSAARWQEAEVNARRTRVHVLRALRLRGRMQQQRLEMMWRNVFLFFASDCRGNLNAVLPPSPQPLLTHLW